MIAPQRCCAGLIVYARLADDFQIFRFSDAYGAMLSSRGFALPFFHADAMLIRIPRDEACQREIFAAASAMLRFHVVDMLASRAILRHAASVLRALRRAADKRAR